MAKRPAGLIAIVVYKLLTSFLLTIASIALLLALENYNNLVAFSESYLLRGRLDILKFILEEILKLKPSTLQFSIIATGIYAIVSGIEAIGLWHQKAWARVLVVLLVGISIPAEIFELFRGMSLLKLVIFLGNVVVFIYLLRHSVTPKTQRKNN
jgi:hypothetical protein